MQGRELYHTALFAIGLCAAGAVWSQQSETVPVTISVTDPTGAVIPDAQIELLPFPNPDQAVMKADAHGQLTAELKQGAYCASFSSPGFQVLHGHIDIRGPVTVPIKLNVGGCTECVEVMSADGSALAVLLASPYQQTILEPAQLRAMNHVSVSVHNPLSGAIERYSGVPLIDLLRGANRFAGNDPLAEPGNKYLVATGVGNQKVVIALAEAEQELHPAEVVIADSLDGKPLDGASGPFELVVGDDRKRDRNVRKLVTIEVKTAE